MALAVKLNRQIAARLGFTPTRLGNEPFGENAEGIFGSNPDDFVRRSSVQIARRNGRMLFSPLL
jgi:hypothetical protein